LSFTHDGPTQADIREKVEARVAQRDQLRKEFNDLVEGDSIPEELKAIREDLINKPNFNAKKVDTIFGFMYAGARQSAARLGMTVKQYLTQRLAGIDPNAEVSNIISPDEDGVSYTQEGRIELNENFDSWFGDSKITETKGDPLLVHHGTQQFGFDAFRTTGGDFGAHFGSIQVAESLGTNIPGDKAGVYSGYIKIDNPLRLEDVGWWSSDTMADQLLDLEIMSEAEYQEYLKINREYSDPANLRERLQYQPDDPRIPDEHIKNFLKSKGYDGVVYLNRREGLDSEKDPRFYRGRSDSEFLKAFPSAQDSYIIFDPSQFKSVTNRGTWDPNNPIMYYQRPGGKKSKGRPPRGQTIFTKDGKALIKLFETADISTVLHELWHVFTDDLINYVESGQAEADNNQQAIEDYNILKDFADGELNVDGIEKIMDAFEQYLMEGKAPSVGLLGAFKRVASWMGDIYRSIKQLGTPINEEVRGVFDRMLASDEEIRDVGRFYGDALKWAEALGADKEQQEALAQAWVSVVDDATDKHRVKLLKAFFKRQELNKKLLKEARDRVHSSPIYSLINQIIREGGLDAEQFTPDELRVLKGIDKRLVKKGGTVSFHEAASSLGFQSEEEFMEVLENTPRRKVAVRIMHEQLKAQAEEEILNAIDSTAGANSQEAVHSEAMLVRLTAEAQLAEDAIARREKRRAKNLTAAAIKQEAEAYLNKQNYLEARNVKKYIDTAKRLAREAYRAAKKGDLTTAAEIKNQQVFNHALAMQAKKNRALSDKEIKKSRKAGNNKTGISYNHRQQILALLEKYSLGTSAQKPDSKKMMSLKKFFEHSEDFEQVPAVIKDWMLTDEESRYQKLPFEKFLELTRAISWLAANGSEKMKAIQDARFQSHSKAAKAMAETMSGLSSKKLFEKGHILSKAKSAVDAILASTTKLPFTFKAMDGFKPGGMGHEILNNLYKADDVRKRILKNISPRVQSIMTDLAKIRKRIEKEFGKKFDVPGVKLPDSLWFNKKIKRWDVEMLLSAALNLGNEKNLHAMKKGYGFTDAEINAIRRMLDSTEWAVIQEMWNLLDESFDPMNEVYKNLNNESMVKEPALPFTVTRKDGTTFDVEGGYYPLIYDHQLADISAEKFAEDVARNHSSAMFRQYDVNKGPTISREWGGLPPVLSLAIIPRHIETVARYISHAEVIRDAHSIFHQPEFKKEFTRVFGVDEFRNLEEGLSHIARPAQGVAGKWAKGFDWMRRMSTFAILGHNLWVAAKQPFSALGAIKEIGLLPTMNALLEMTAHPMESIRQIHNLSTYMDNRSSSFDREVQEHTKKLRPFQRGVDIGDKRITWKDVQNFGFIWIRMADAATVYPLWTAAYNKELARNGGDSDAAVTYADDLIRTTQPSADPIDLSSWQRSKDVIPRVLSMFQTFLLTYGNRTRYHLRALREGRMSPMEFGKHLFYEQFLPPILMTAFISMLKEGELPEDEEEFLWSAAGYYTSWIPMVNFLVPALQYDTRQFDSPAFEGFDRAQRAFGEVKDFVNAETEKDRKKAEKQLLWSLGHLAEFIKGVPWLKAYKRMADAVERHTDDS
jgi:hypothetical protein